MDKQHKLLKEDEEKGVEPQDEQDLDEIARAGEDKSRQRAREIGQDKPKERSQ